MDRYINKIKAIIVEKTGLDPEDINENSYFEDDLNVGQMELYDIITAVEDEYAVEFEEEEKDNVESVMDLVEIVVEKLE